MADKQSKSRELSVKIDVDVSEALTGLKAVERQAKKATQALKEAESAHRQYDHLYDMYVDEFEDDTEYRVKEHASLPGVGVVIDDTARKLVKLFDLTIFSTKSLSEELARREGVTSIYFDKGDTEFTQITVDHRRRGE